MVRGSLLHVHALKQNYHNPSNYGLAADKFKLHLITEFFEFYGWMVQLRDIPDTAVSGFSPESELIVSWSHIYIH